VLFRSSYLSFDLEIELTKANIPFVKFGGFKFVETAHIKDLVAHLRVLENPRDAVAWNRILLLVEGVGPRTAEKVIDDVLARRIATTNAAFWTQYNNYPSKMRDLFDVLKTASPEHLSPAEKVMQLVGYYQPIFSNRYDDYPKRQKDIEMFQQITDRYISVGTLLADLALEPTNESVIDVEAPNSDDEKLILSTIHSAKGLEWNTEFILYVLEGRFPASRAVLNDDALEEERRLMYVACTRAKEHLYAIYPINIYDRESGLVLSKPSRFIADLPEQLIDTWVVGEE
jgi:ATP-dependent DNA helicase UvrD/PcrA